LEPATFYRTLMVDSEEVSRLDAREEAGGRACLIGVRDKALLLFAWASGGRRRSKVTSAVVEQLVTVDANT